MTALLRERICRHEAGHAVLMICYGLPFGVVCAYDAPVNGWGGHLGANAEPLPALADEPTLARTYWADVLKDPALARHARVYFVRQAIVDAAGVAAEFSAMRATSPEHAISSRGDRRNFDERCAAWGVRACWGWFVREAIEEVDFSWGAIEAVAEALDVRGVLEREPIAEIVALTPKRWNTNREPPWETMPLTLID